MDKTDLTAHRLRELLHYEPETGVFTWRVSTSNRARIGALAGTYKRGYLRIGLCNRVYAAHRLAWLYVTGAMPVGWLDHINRNPRDNRIANLRGVTPSENRQNATAPANNASGYKGVTRTKNGRFTAQIGHKRKSIYLGTFTSAHEASQAYAEAAKHLHTCNPLALK